MITMGFYNYLDAGRGEMDKELTYQRLAARMKMSLWTINNNQLFRLREQQGYQQGKCIRYSITRIYRTAPVALNIISEPQSHK